MNAKWLFTLHLSKKKLFILVTVNRNSYEPRWCQRPVELQNRLVEGFCFAGARGRSRRDLPSSHTTAGHQTAERRQTETAFGKLLSRGGQRAKKTPILIHRFPAKQSCVNTITALISCSLMNCPTALKPRISSQLLSEGFCNNNQ